MRGALLRKMQVTKDIGRLDKDVRDIVSRVYAIYDRLEYWTIIPLYLFMMSCIIVPLVGYVQEAPIELGEYGKPLTSALSLLLWTLGYLLARRAYILPKRRALRREIRETLDATGRREEILTTIRRIDPDIVRNTGNLR